MSDKYLVLHPVDPTVDTPSISEICKLLSSVGLLGDLINPANESGYKPGARFNELIGFRNPPENWVDLTIAGDLSMRNDWIPHSHTAITTGDIHDEIEFLGTANTETPSCKNCDHIIADWGEVVAAWYKDKERYKWICPDCNTKLWPWELDWKHLAGFGKISIEIWDPWASLAVPTKELNDSMLKFTGVDWDYFFYHH